MGSGVVASQGVGDVVTGANDALDLSRIPCDVNGNGDVLLISDAVSSSRAK